MNPIERIRGVVIEEFPGVSAVVDPPAFGSGSWNLDIRRGNDYLMFVEWRPGEGVGVSTPSPDDLWSGHDEVYNDDRAATARILHLLRSGQPTVPPLAVQLAELRRLVGLSQAELAGRMGVKQANVSRIESRGDILVGTLSKVVAAVGASLTITARFPDGRERVVVL